MLRHIMISLGFLVTFLPYLGFPHSWQMVITTTSGFLIVMLLMFSRRGKIRRTQVESSSLPEETSLHVEHLEIEERPEVHVEREIYIDSTGEKTVQGVETKVEKKVTVSRRRRKDEKKDEIIPSDGNFSL